MTSVGPPGVCFVAVSPERCLIPLTGRGGDVARLGGLEELPQPPGRAEPSQAEFTTPPTNPANHPGPGLQSRLRTGPVLIHHEGLLRDPQQRRRVHALLPDLRLRLHRIPRRCGEDGT